MPDLKGRADFEEQIARVLGKVSAETRRELIALLGDPPKAEALTAEVWRTIEGRYNGALLPQLEQVYMAALEETAASVGVGFAWDIANERAISWARQYTYELVHGINRTSQQWLTSAITDFYNADLSYNDLITRVGTVFGSARAESIAVTEVTRAAAAGSMEYQRELNEMGVRTIEVWQTARDDVTCPICAPLQGRKRGDGWDSPPPAHPRCRCFMTIEPVIEASR